MLRLLLMRLSQLPARRTDGVWPRKCCAVLCGTLASPRSWRTAISLVKTTDDVGLMLADPGARLLALWGMRDRWWRLGQDAAEEEAQGPSASGRTPEGIRVLNAATSAARPYPLVQAMLLVALRVQLDLLLALTEVAVGSPSRYGLSKLPDPLQSAARALRKQPAAEALPWLAQQTVWHWRGSLRRSDLPHLAADAGLSPEAAFSVLNVASQLYRNWTAVMAPEESLRRKNKRREQELLARPVVHVSAVPGLLRTTRRRPPKSAADSSAPNGGLNQRPEDLPHFL